MPEYKCRIIGCENPAYTYKLHSGGILISFCKKHKCTAALCEYQYGYCDHCR